MDVTYPKELKENGHFTKYLALAVDPFSAKEWTKVLMKKKIQELEKQRWDVEEVCESS